MVHTLATSSGHPYHSSIQLCPCLFPRPTCSYSLTSYTLSLQFQTSLLSHHFIHPLSFTILNLFLSSSSLPPTPSFPPSIASYISTPFFAPSSTSSLPSSSTSSLPSSSTSSLHPSSTLLLLPPHYLYPTSTPHNPSYHHFPPLITRQIPSLTFHPSLTLSHSLVFATSTLSFPDSPPPPRACSLPS